MITLGVDLASQPKNTAICLIRWDGKLAHVEELRRDKSTGGDDQDLHRLFAQADRIGIDAPFGWPHSFTRALWDYSDPTKKTDWPSDADRLRYRETDQFVLRQIGLRPLSVSSDLIAWTARRAARLLSKVSNDETVDRSGECGRFVEVYPAAALKVWNLRWSGYKTGAKGKDNRICLVKSLVERTDGWLRLSDRQEADCKRSDDLLDALIAALVARAKNKRICREPKSLDEQKLAREEGWIALPMEGSLDRLATE